MIRISIDNARSDELAKSLDDKNISYKRYKNYRKNENQTRFYICITADELLMSINKL